MDGLFTYDPLVTGTKGIILIDDKLLIYRRDTNTSSFPLYLDFPGGGAENMETPFEAFQRELKEEFNLDIMPSQITYARRYPSVVAGKFVYELAAHLPAHTADMIVFGNEGLEWMLMPVAEFLKRSDAWPIHQERLRDYLESL